MTDHTLTFAEYLHVVHQAYEDLMSAPLGPALEQLNVPTTGGIYVFYEQGQPIYVGRTRNLRRRLRQHSHSGSTHYSASFAFLIARRQAALPKVPKMTRQQIAAGFAVQSLPATRGLYAGALGAGRRSGYSVTAGSIRGRNAKDY